jgi:hypothetical protein
MDGPDDVFHKSVGRMIALASELPYAPGRHRNLIDIAAVWVMVTRWICEQLGTWRCADWMYWRSLGDMRECRIGSRTVRRHDGQLRSD